MRLARHARRLTPLPLVILLLSGCAFLAEVECRGNAERAGLYLGTRQSGESCTTETIRSRDRRHTERITRCTPTYRDIYQWNANSDRVFQTCMAALAPPPPPQAPPPPASPVK